MGPVGFFSLPLLLLAGVRSPPFVGAPYFTFNLMKFSPTSSHSNGARDGLALAHQQRIGEHSGGECFIAKWVSLSRLGARMFELSLSPVVPVALSRAASHSLGPITRQAN